MIKDILPRNIKAHFCFKRNCNSIQIFDDEGRVIDLLWIMRSPGMG